MILASPQQTHNVPKTWPKAKQPETALVIPEWDYSEKYTALKPPPVSKESHIPSTPLSSELRVFGRSSLYNIITQYATLPENPDQENQEFQEARINVASSLEMGIALHAGGREAHYRRKLNFIIRLIQASKSKCLEDGLDPIRMATAEEARLISRYKIGPKGEIASSVTKQSFDRHADETQHFFASSAPRKIRKGKCPRCPCTRLMEIAIQTRSADEGATAFYFCMQCGSPSKPSR